MFMPQLQDMGQDDLESGLRFLGFAVMVNALRPDTCDAIAALQAADIRTVVVTGDHVRTAVSVAHQCRCGDSPDSRFVKL